MLGKQFSNFYFRDRVLTLISLPANLLVYYSKLDTTIAAPHAMTLVSKWW